MNANKQASQTETHIGSVQSKEAGLVFTGERYVPTEQGEIRLEHFHRYAVALDIVAGKDVLDIASGEGYGSFLLATVARTVTGIDISQEAVRHASATYRSRNNLTFQQGGATKIDLPDHTFDIVISFETIEHLAEQSKMLSEIRRVLRPSGILLISSPNRPVYSEATGNHNEFHVKELDFKEFNSLLREQFNAISYLGQRLLIGSIIQPLDGAVVSLRALRDDGINVQQTAGELLDPVYFLAICGAAEATIPTIDASIMQPDKLDLLKQYISYANWAISSNKELELLNKLHGELNEEHHKVATWAKSLDNQISTVTHALSEREQQISMLSDERVQSSELVLGLEAHLKTVHEKLFTVEEERDSYVTRLVQIDKELKEVRELYARLDQKYEKVGTQIQLLDKQLSETAQILSEREIQIAKLSNESIKRRECVVDLEAQLKSTKAELLRVISERDSQIKYLNQSVVVLNEQLSKLNRNVLKAETDLKLQEQVNLNKLKQNTFQFEQEKKQYFIVCADKEKILSNAHAERERVLHERLIAMQVQLRKTDQECSEKISLHTYSAEQKKNELHAQIMKLQQQIQDSERTKIQLALSQSATESALKNKYAERERTLHERLFTMQGELQKVDHEWLKKSTDQENLVARERTDLNAQIVHLQHEIQELNHGKLQLSASHAKQEHVLIQENAERERSLHKQLQDAQDKLQEMGNEWAEKATAQRHEVIKQKQSSATLLVQLEEHISAAKQHATRWELTQTSLLLEMNTIKSSLSWRLTAPMRKLGQRIVPGHLHKTVISQQLLICDTGTTNPAATYISKDRQCNTKKYIQEASMNHNPLTVASQLDAPITSLDDLLYYQDEAFVDAAYQTFLRRAPDKEGMSYYMSRLRRGVEKLQILEQIYRSKEAQLFAVKLPGLEDALKRNKWLKFPVIGAMMRKHNNDQILHSLESQLFLLHQSNGRRFDQIEKAITTLQQTVVRQAQTAAGAAAIQQLKYASVDSWQTVENLLSFEGRNFLENLFQLGLGRPPEAHEVHHYIHVLAKGVSKIHVIELIFSCAESKTWLAPERVAAAPVNAKSILQVDTNGMTQQPIAVIAESIHFVERENPLVSVVIPVYGKIEYTLMCLKSIQQHVPEVEFEIIVVDDKSPDNTVTELKKVRGIKVVVNTNNLGFIRSCNYGAEHAKGQYLCFLNNDTEVTRGWLDELVRTFHEFPGTGLAGSKFVYPNGTLQEAGGILWKDGSAWNFGRNQDPSLPVYNYAREVDYCSGASIMITSALFSKLGGFDEHYLPAYCEDSDLALKVRDNGYRVIYQPLSVVVHYEGITSGTDTSQGTKSYQIENSIKLFARWKDTLKHHQANGTDVDNAKDRTAKRRVLILDHCTPTPNQDAGSVTVFNLLLLLREMNFQVTFIPEDNFLYMPEYTTALQRIGVEVLYAPYYTSVEHHLIDSGSRYELAFLFRPLVVERHLKSIRNNCPNTKILYHTIDLHYLRMMREAELLKDSAKKVEAKEMKQREFSAIKAVDASIVHSTKELEILRPELRKEKIHVFPLILNVRGTEKKYQERSGIVFVGGYQHAPNVDAVQYFVKDVMPLLRRRLPKIHFYAVGSKPPQVILDLAAEDVIITGYVEDLNPLLDKMRIAVAPLRYGAGIKGKIGTAMAIGLPTVATTLAAEGMKLTDGENILVADGVQAFASQIVKLYNNEELWNEISEAGVSFAESAWGAETAAEILLAILNDLNLKIEKNGRPIKLYSTEPNQVSQKKDFMSQPLVEMLVQPAENNTYAEKVLQELKIFEKQVTVHDLPEIFHYWSNKWLKPMFQEAGFDTIENFFSKNLLAASERTKSTIPRFVSIGSGNCDLEVSVAKMLRQSGLKKFIFECIELNPVMVERGKKIAEDAGVRDVMRFTEADFNDWIPEVIYDGVMANQSLHHVTRLEHLFAQVKEKMHLKGAFIISDMIGRNGHQRWPESYELVQKFWKELPQSYKYNVVLERHEEEYENWDCSREGFEGIRAQDIMPLLLDSFYCESFVGFCSSIDIFIDRCFGRHFKSDAQWDKDFIDRVHLADEEGLKNGVLTPTHCCAVFVKQHNTKSFYLRGLDPKTAIRKDK